MQDGDSSPVLFEQSDRISGTSDVGYTPMSKSTTALTNKRRATSHHTSIHRPDLTVNPKTGKRHEKKFGYAPPASDREGWWRVTIKVYFKKSSFLE